MEPTTPSSNSERIQSRLPAFTRLANHFAQALNLSDDTFTSTYQKQCQQASALLDRFLASAQAPALRVNYYPFNAPSLWDRMANQLLNKTSFSDPVDRMAFHLLQPDSEAHSTIVYRPTTVSKHSPLKTPEVLYNIIQSVNIDSLFLHHLQTTNRLINEYHHQQAPSEPWQDLKDPVLSSYFSILAHEWGHSWSQAHQNPFIQWIGDIFKNNHLPQLADGLNSAQHDDHHPLSSMSHHLHETFSDLLAVWVLSRTQPYHVESLLQTRDFLQQRQSSSIYNTAPVLRQFLNMKPAPQDISSFDEWIAHVHEHSDLLMASAFSFFPKGSVTPDEMTRLQTLAHSLPSLPKPSYPVEDESLSLILPPALDEISQRLARQRQEAERTVLLKTSSRSLHHPSL